MKGKIYLTTIIVLLSSLSFFAQTPTVLTLKASGVSSTQTPEGSPNIFITATLNGAVNANGTNCTVSFEYGNTTSYGNTIAASPGTVTGSGDNAINAAVTINYTHTSSTQERLIHYRLKVVNENGTYYGRDFTAIPIDRTRNIFISAPCLDSQTMANFDMANYNQSFDLTVNYNAGAGYTGNVIIGSYQTQQIFVPKGSVCAFYYANNLFLQVLTNDQICSETQLARQKVWMTATGAIASDKFMFRIENGNNYPVDLNLLNQSTNYPNTIAANSVAYLVADKTTTEMSVAGVPFLYSEPNGYTYEGMGWLKVTSLSTTATTADFELYNRDDAAHTFVLRNAGGTENSYTLAANESRTITLANENWSVYITIWDPTGMYYGFRTNRSDYIYTGPAFGNAAYCNNGLLKIATATPGSALTPSVSSASIASSTSLTLNGAIANSAFVNADADYHFIYGTDPNNLNLSSATQSGTVPASGSLNVSATVTGLTAETMYYFKLVAATTQSSAKKIFLSTAIPTTNLKLHLRSDLAVTSASSSVSNWGDVSGFDNDGSQSTSANQPTLVSNSMNGNPVIRFNGTNSKLTLPTSATIGIQNNSYEMFVVAKSASSNVQFLISGNATEQFEYHLSGVGVRFIPITSAYLDLGSSGAFTDGNAHIFSGRASSSGGAVRVDGIDGGTSSANILSSNSGALQLGVRSDGAYYFNGDIAEVILYNTNLSASDRSTVEHYLANRYGITSSALPVELTSFSAECRAQSVELKWTTATEVNNYGFNVEWRMENGEWRKIGFVQGHGNSNSPKSYSFTDNLANTLALNHDLNLNRLQYRLKQIDFDGKYEYSKVVEVKVDVPTKTVLEQNYPNPFNPSTTINYQLSTSSHVTLKVFDMLGREVVTLVDEYKQAGTYNSTFNTLRSSFSSGAYLYQLKAGGFIETKKFILMK
ncbi:MAG: T9SS type A sorting domain-containing protein [Ignavibacteriales bacterium]|nr:T9SS type A sorting domain-containing protein [Ignavibacteriales bacterium]